jgi:integrase/recombinase XerD
MNNPTRTLDGSYRTFIDAMRIEAGLAANTIEAYQRDGVALLGFLGQLGRIRPAQVSPSDLSQYVGHLRALGLADRTVSRMTISARMFFKYLSDTGQLMENPAASLPAGRLDRVLPSVLSHNDVEKLLDAPGFDTSLAIRDRAILHCLYASGARVSEVCGIRDSDVSLGEGVLRLSGKGGKERLAPIGERAIAAIQLYIETSRPALLGQKLAPWLLVSRTGKKLTRARIWQVVQMYGASVGIPDWLCHPHTLRHCFATHLLENGADVRAVQVMLGHEDIETTQIYTHVDAKRLKSVVASYHPRGRRTA